MTNNYRNNINNKRDAVENPCSHDVWWASFLLAVAWVFSILADKQQSSRGRAEVLGERGYLLDLTQISQTVEMMG